MNSVKINGKNVRLSNADVIGVGGEATVFKHNGQAVKVYLQADNARDNKLRAMMPRVGGLPSNVIAPNSLVMDGKGKQVVGFTMRLLDATHTEARQLAVKKYRAKTSLTSRDVVRLFLNMWQTLDCIHQAGMVVGDLNDLNIMFKDSDMIFIDTDSFQFATYPCMVGTEAFLDPAFYGKDLSQQAFFSPANDWYSFAVLLFKSLLLTHPYGGVHPSIKLMTQRAQQRVSVFDSSVIYPRIAYSPDLLTDELGQAFADWFTQGQRGTFPQNVLQDYILSVKDCPHCGATYPAYRSHCPMCAAVVPVATIAPDKILVETLLETGGDIITWRVIGSKIRALTHENGKAVLYEVDKFKQQRRLELFNAMPNATYTFMGDVLVISPSRDSDTLMLVDISGDKPAPVLQTTTEAFSGTTPMFGTSVRHLYRIAGGYLMRGHIEYGQLVEQSILSISEGQTWFTVAPDEDRVFGYFRAFNDETYWLLQNDQHIDADLYPLDPTEFLTDIHAVFADQSVMVLRQTQFNGVERIRIDEIDHKGRQLHTSITTAADFGAVHGHAYMRSMLLQATDVGIVQTRLDTSSTKTFPQTEPVVQRGDTLLPFNKGLLAVKDKRIVYLKIH